MIKMTKYYRIMFFKSLSGTFWFLELRRAASKLINLSGVVQVGRAIELPLNYKHDLDLGTMVSRVRQNEA